MEGFGWYAVKLGALCTFVYFLSLIFPDIHAWFALVSAQVFSRPWTIVTHIFLHGDLMHLGSNMFALLLFGSILEKEIGSRRFLLVFFASGIVSSAADVMFYPSTIGASGAIFGILGLLAVLKPKMIVWVLGVPMYMVVAAGVWALLDLTGMFYPSNVAHAAHLFGLGFGIALGLLMRKPGPRKEKKEEVLSRKELEEWEDRYMSRIPLAFNFLAPSDIQLVIV